MLRSLRKLHSWVHTCSLSMSHTQSSAPPCVDVCETSLAVGSMSFVVVTVNFDLCLDEAGEVIDEVSLRWLIIDTC